MKIIIKLCCVILSLSIISIICEAQDKKTNGKNEIRLGTGKIALGVCELFSPVPIPHGGLTKDSIDIHIISQSILDKDGEFNEIPLNKTILVRSLSVVGAGDLRGPDTSTRGPCWTDLRFTGCSARSTAG